jgi:hypothetical protein
VILTSQILMLEPDQNQPTEGNSMPSQVRTSTLFLLTLLLLAPPIQAYGLHQAKIQREGLVHQVTTLPLNVAQYIVEFDGGITVSLEVPRGVDRARASVTTPTETRSLYQIKQRDMMPPGPDDATTWLSFRLSKPDTTALHVFKFEVDSPKPFSFTRILLGQPSKPNSRIIGASGPFIPPKNATVIKAGEDLLGTHEARQFIRFPPGFLGTGVEGFEGLVAFGEDPFQPGVNNVDTVMVRLEDVLVGGTVPVRLLRFQNRTRKPITVQSTTGPQQFEMRASLSPNAVSGGFVTINADGTYQSSTALYPVFTIQRVDKGRPIGNPFVIDTALVAVPGFPFYLASKGGKWTDQPPAGRMVTPASSNFFYNNGETNTFEHSNGGHLKTAACLKASAE